MKSYDLIVIGGGTAGLVTAAGAANLGVSVALIEREALGGDCLWTGCVPSKALIASARLAHQMRHADALGLAPATPAHAFDVVMRRMRKVRERVAHHDDPQRFRDMGVDVRFGDARFVSDRCVTVGGSRLTAKRFVVATGADAYVPPIEGLVQAPHLTYASAFDQDELPKRLVVIGGGPIGLEFAQIYRRLGASVVVVEMLPHLLATDDCDVTDGMLDALRCDGIEVMLGATVQQVAPDDGGTTVVVDGESGPRRLMTDSVFVATGRRARTTGLGLEEIGIVTERHALRVDAGLRTTVPHIWGAGDVVGGPQFTHVADYQAKLVLRNAFFPFSSRASYDQIPSVIYTDPEVARVGLSEREATEKYGADAEVFQYDFADLDRAIVDGKARGFVKLIAGPRNKIVGATIVASDAGNLIMPIVLAMRHGLKVTALSRIVYPYPTLVEGIKRAADNYYREKFKGRSGEWLRKVVRWLK